MKREIAAGALLALLILGSVCNLRRIDRLTEDIFLNVNRSEQAMADGRTEDATAKLKEGLELWLQADSYTHVFLRHSEIDSTTDAFYEALEELSDNDSEATSAAYEKLRYHLDSLQRMEHISLGSVL